MAIKDSTVFPDYGAVFYAPVGTALPTGGIKAFTIMAETVAAGGDGGAQWTNLGHTSQENGVTINLDGGETESSGSWQVHNLRTKSTSAASLTVEITSLQMNKDTFKLIYGSKSSTGAGVGANLDMTPNKMAIVIIAQDTPDDDEKNKFGLQIRSTSIKPNGGPTFGDNFVEQGMTATAESVQGEDDFTFYLPDDFAA
ncbi:hypothetical protein [Bifidobacterium cuniculi]|uniref:Gp23 n=1 Tax=Bifidobacterium cuniculi TaxID=1688 RepID=A0A087AFG8_9BIFI|nr:hypothetical protein [Bifidobacterium cuniculi]KFI57518.1 gp23 [Bifidobacterium cuniculi]